MKLDIAVLGARRPRYLYVCLDALFRVEGIERSNVYVYIDGTGDKEANEYIQKQMIPYIVGFPVADVIFFPFCFGQLKAHMEARGQTFAKSCDAVLLVEDDLILSTDSLDYLYKTMVAEKASSYNLFNVNSATLGKDTMLKKLAEKASWDATLRMGGYNPRGSVLAKEVFKTFENQIKVKAYLDLFFRGTSMKIGSQPGIEGRTYDGILDALALANDWGYITPVKTRLGHFGVCNSPLIIPDKDKLSRSTEFRKDRAALEAEFFVGPKETWLDNICSIFRSDRLCTLEYATMAPFYWDYK